MHCIHLETIECSYQLYYAHRDIKEENMLIDKEGYIRIADFGLSRVLRDGIARSLCGTPGYQAPEMLQGLPYSTPVDWWAVGVLLYNMLIGAVSNLLVVIVLCCFKSRSDGVG
jgi:serum/glucocorticoid-regulated kinase 2